MDRVQSEEMTRYTLKVDNRGGTTISWSKFQNVYSAWSAAVYVAKWVPHHLDSEEEDESDLDSELAKLADEDCETAEG